MHATGVRQARRGRGQALRHGAVRSRAGPAAATGRPTRPSARWIVAGIRCRGPREMMRSSVDLPAPFGPVSAMRSGPRMSRSMPLSPNSSRPPRLISKTGARGQHVRPAGTSVSGRSSTMTSSSRTARSASSSRDLASSTACGVHVVGCARRTPGRLRFSLPATIFGRPGVLDVARRGARPPRGAFAGLLHLAFLTLQQLLGIADVGFGDALRVARPRPRSR